MIEHWQSASYSLYGFLCFDSSISVSCDNFLFGFECPRLMFRQIVTGKHVLLMIRNDL